jgi:protein-arginine kinase activator protein McsA
MKIILEEMKKKKKECKNCYRKFETLPIKNEYCSHRCYSEALGER